MMTYLLMFIEWLCLQKYVSMKLSIYRKRRKYTNIVTLGEFLKLSLLPPNLQTCALLFLMEKSYF